MTGANTTRGKVTEQMAALTIRVFGLPAPQGSKRGYVRGGKVALVESSKAVKPWREAVKWAALEVLKERNGTRQNYDGQWMPRRDPLSGPLHVVASFTFVRPRSHYGTGRNATRLRDAAPSDPAGKPDLDKLLRSTFDALTDVAVWADDGQVVRVTARKCYGDTAGATLLITTDLLRRNGYGDWPGATT